jgi:hypothetical protein
VIGPSSLTAIRFRSPASRTGTAQLRPPNGCRGGPVFRRTTYPKPTHSSKNAGPAMAPITPSKVAACMAAAGFVQPAWATAPAHTRPRIGKCAGARSLVDFDGEPAALQMQIGSAGSGGRQQQHGEDTDSAHGPFPAIGTSQSGQSPQADLRKHMRTPCLQSPGLGLQHIPDDSTGRNRPCKDCRSRLLTVVAGTGKNVRTPASVPGIWTAWRQMPENRSV